MPSKTPALSIEARRIQAAGQRLHGVRWIRPMAEAMGISRPLLNLIMLGKRPVTADVKARIPAAFEHRRREIQKAKADLEAAIHEYNED